MKALKSILCISALALLGSCGYHVGNIKNPCLGENKTFCVDMFENTTFYAMAGMQMTNALTDALQSDGTFRMASHAEGDLTISGRVVDVTVSHVRTNPRDSYVSDEVNLAVTVRYQVKETKTGKVLMSKSVRGVASSANQLGNVQSARDDAVSWAVRQAAARIVESMTTP